MKKRWGTLLFAGLLGTAVLSGCGSSASDSASTAAADSAAAETTTSSENTKEDLIFVNYRDIRDLNPHLYAGEMYAQEMLYEGLVNITANGFEGCLAESWDVSEDGKVYTNGGRVLNVTALGGTFEEARDRAYEACDLIDWDGKFMRRDIGARAMRGCSAWES